ASRRAPIPGPTLVLIDALSLGVATTIVAMLLTVVRQIHETGLTVVVVEQSVNVALRLAERAVFMEKGEFRFTGPTAELLERPDILRSVFIEGAGPAVKKAAKKTRKAARTKPADAAIRTAPPADAPVVLECVSV